MQIQLAIFCTLLALTVALPARKLVRNGTEILVCGELYDIGTRVVLYGDVGGYDAYRTERRFWRLNESDWDHTHAWDPVIFNVPNRFAKEFGDLVIIRAIADSDTAFEPMD